MKKVLVTKLEGKSLFNFLKVNDLLKYIKHENEITEANIDAVELQPLSKNILPLVSIKDPAIEELSDYKRYDIVCELHESICLGDIPHKQYRIIF